jgi:translation initiation factor IF-2
MLAAASNADRRRVQRGRTPRRSGLAEREGVDIRTYRDLALEEDIQRGAARHARPEQVEEVLGEAEARQIFRASRIGTIAGCMVTQGVIQRGAQVRSSARHDRLRRPDRTLKRFQDDARAGRTGFEWPDPRELQRLKGRRARGLRRDEVPHAPSGASGVPR